MDKAKNEINLKDFVTYLGPIELWSSPVKEAVEFCLGSSYAVTIYFGDIDNFIFMYNRTSAFGKAFKESLPNTYDNLRKVYELILKGKSVFRRDDPNLDPIVDDNILEQRYYTYSMSPIREKDGKITAMLGVCEDTTDKFLRIERIVINTPNNLTQLIKELTVEKLQITEIREEESENSENLLHLYNKITNAEVRKEIANRDVIKSYYLFGKVLFQRFKYYSDESSNVHQAQMRVNEELEKQLPGTTKNARNKRKERAQKIYSFFNDIGIEKIELVKSFSADSISKLSIKKIKYIKDEIMKTQNT
ncbi:5884_t:CDS:2 [Cetraspora pellucida]|uniref:5884_t:CDS:1 n=1 Tax=Cetraspora pellucida TaxID=1433469 RepID=A0A9N9CHZ8_9GLOM|nr:5884_t:CDS:2 [Cetraspora pellucida]